MVTRVGGKRGGDWGVSVGGSEADKDRGWSQLMAAAQAGDRRAYERLLRETVPFIRSVIAHQHRRPDRLEEVVQEVLLAVHRVRHTYDPSRPFRHWLAMIARRRSIDALRRRGRTEANEVSDELAYETFADPAANRELEVSAATEGLGEAIAGLSPPQREAIELLKLREMSLKEASRASGRSVAALKVNVHRAIKALRQRLQGE
jgi:RNA polymerase sigma-70 factor, ECF subfamily